MKAKTTIIITCIALLGLLAYLPAQTVGQANGFAERVSGTYVQVGSFPPNPEFRGAITLHDDGTVISTNINEFGATGTLQSEGYGIWERTGPFQVTVTSLIFTYLDPGGTQSFVVKAVVVMDFNPTYSTATGTITSEIYNPVPLGGDFDLDGIPDYVDYSPAVQPLLCVNGVHTTYRLRHGLSTAGCP